MTAPSFERLFSLPAFEGLRALRIQIERTPSEELATQIEIVKHTDANASAYDMEAATSLHQIVPAAESYSSVRFYRTCISAVLKTELPIWARLVTLGRGKFIRRLKAEELRDVRSLFRQAKLLEDPAGQNASDWWDEIQLFVRHQQGAEKLRQGRQAELLTIEHEKSRLKKLGISTEPKWMAIDDNTVGYDVLSYDLGDLGLVNRLIEVKSTIASPLRFIVSRNEWDKALKFGKSYVFHVWDMRQDPPILHERTAEMVESHIPTDRGKGSWKDTYIPVGM